MKLKKYQKIVDKILALDGEYSQLSDEQLKHKTIEFKERLNKGEKLDSLLVEAFATCREASWRVLGMKQFPVQLLGGIVLHNGMIAEMKTGEGKTLVAVCPVYLNALTGKGVHVVTVNDYLAKRDSDMMKKVYGFLGLTTGCILSQMPLPQKMIAYNSDITYGTNVEFGFDYLRDNMAINKKLLMQRELNFVIIDEVDSILIDEARTPLIISGGDEQNLDIFPKVDAFVKTLKRSKNYNANITKADSLIAQMENAEDAFKIDGDYVYDEKEKTLFLTENGIKKAEQWFDIEDYSDPVNMTLSHFINQSLRANYAMHRDKDYIIKDGQIAIVDEFTGRVMDGRKYSDNLHQSIEAKEGLQINPENTTKATISYQNYFRLYNKMAGMTGTADTEAVELKEIYKLSVVQIPTNKPVIRDDYKDKMFQSKKAKYEAVIADVKELHSQGRPVLIGTPSVELSEELSSVLSKNGVKHNVLNAKNHSREAQIVAQAGRFGAVTIATNMAGRGTDILLGGNPEFLAKQELQKEGFNTDEIEIISNLVISAPEEYEEARNKYIQYLEKMKEVTAKEKEKVVNVGGLAIIGTDRHDSRRIDNQLRGRAGRQGDPGSSQFYLSLEDELIRIFGGEQLKTLNTNLGYEESDSLDESMYSKLTVKAQKKVETINYEMRKATLEYDDVNNLQRKQVYNMRRRVLFYSDEELVSMFERLKETSVEFVFSKYTCGNRSLTDVDVKSINEYYSQCFGDENFDINTKNIGEAKSYVVKRIDELILNKKEILKENNDNIANVIRHVFVQVLDKYWISYINSTSSLKEAVNLTGYGVLHPIQLYKSESVVMFDELLEAVNIEFVRAMIAIKLRRKQPNVIKLKPVVINLDNE